MSDPTESPTLPHSLRLLKALVIVLMLTMIGAVITVTALLVTLMPQSFGASAPDLPATLTLPAGAKAATVTFGTGWIAVVTTDDRILIFGADGVFRQEVALAP